MLFFCFEVFCARDQRLSLNLSGGTGLDYDVLKLDHPILVPKRIAESIKPLGRDSTGNLLVTCCRTLHVLHEAVSFAHVVVQSTRPLPRAGIMPPIVFVACHHNVCKSVHMGFGVFAFII